MALIKCEDCQREISDLPESVKITMDMIKAKEAREARQASISEMIENGNIEDIDW